MDKPRIDMSQRIVVYAGTQNVYPQMYTSLKSLLLNNDVDAVYLLIETDDFPYYLPNNVFICNVSKQEFFRPGSANFDSQWSYMDMLKCCLCEMFPEEIEQVLWLDIDTIVDGDISELFRADMNGYYFAGALEPKKSSGIFRYINAGVLLENVKLLRDTNKGIEMVKYLSRYKFNWPSQDVLNLLCQGHIKVVDSEFNYNAFSLPCTKPKIIHFAASKDYVENSIYKKYERAELPVEEEKTDERNDPGVDDGSEHPADAVCDNRNPGDPPETGEDGQEK